jgi:hypothetical protein
MSSFTFPRPGESVRDAVVRNMITFRVQKDIFCPVTGQVLDIRTCVAVVGGPDNDDVLAVVSPEGWQQKGDKVREAKPDITVWIGGQEQTEETPTDG